MRMHLTRGRLVCALGFVFATVSVVGSQVKYDTGQNVQPAFDGWVRNVDGSIDMYFGYLNRNFVEELNIPIGPDNSMEPNGPDRGQPTYFLPRRQRYVFSVRVPKDWDPKRDVVWTLAAHGRTSRIFGTLNPEDEIVERNVLTNGNFAALEPGHVDVNKPPAIQVNPKQTFALPGAFTLTATINDDGLPKPRGRRVIRSTRDTATQVLTVDEAPEQQLASQLRITWIQYRGPGTATFEPPTVFATAGKDATTKVTFSDPGTYVLRAYARDGQFRSRMPVDVTVTVTESSSSENRLR